ncbi:hypothetical protein L6164_002003 [Bauhinia variegata]|uniref:Uncharacterized protein n=1 Tax=Bauhinia variegata TaxID=167791 RepID=A0ACB9PXF0_BAUVA|nr:hypothetical protein L6164_002003 [Bauhinia variegata]
MRHEITALEKNGTWAITHLLLGKEALEFKWLYKVEGIDYIETFAPVAKMVIVQAVLAVVASRNLELHQMDMHNAFLHGYLYKEVYMKLPLSFHTSNPGMVCRLKQSLYGLKQAPRCWFAKLSPTLQAYGFKQSLSDYSLFVLQRPYLHLGCLFMLMT